MKILVINGPNLNMLHERPASIYGNISLEETNKKMLELAEQLDIELEFFQSNNEGALIDSIHQAHERVDGIIINPGAYTHYSIAIRDALEILNIPVIEVHLTNIYSREEFRCKSVISPVVSGVVCGLGNEGYYLALHALRNKILQ